MLVNPSVASKPLELKATLVRDKPREVTLLDPEGRPVVGVQAEGLTYHPWDSVSRFAATFPLRKLEPDLSRRITFVKEDRKLIGFLLARGDGETPYTVRMQPWAAVTGRILDENARPLTAVGTSAKATNTRDSRHENPKQISEPRRLRDRRTPRLQDQY